MNILNKLWMVYRLNQHFYRWSAETLRRHQEKRTAIILSKAKKSSPYYHRLLSRQSNPSFATVPKVDKAKMMAHFDEINTAGLIKADLIDFQLKQEKEGTLGLYKGEFSVGVSSGTSGNKGLTVLSEGEREMYSCLLWARNGIPKSIKSRRVLFTLRTNNPAFMEVQSFGLKIVYMDYTHPIKDYIHAINDRELNIIAGPPSLLVMIARQHRDIKHVIDAVISYAEVLTDEIRSEIEKAFGIQVIQIYQGSEGFIASTCRMGKLHLNEDTILVELEDTKDTLGQAKNVVVTDLYRTTQPIIRYSLNDVLEISDKPCACGSCFRVVERIHGRANDVFQLRGINTEFCYLFPDYVQKAVIHASDAIIDYQVIQHSVDAIEVRLILKESSNRAQIEKAVTENLAKWSNKAGGILCEVTFTTKPPEINPVSKKYIRVIRKF
ncbi:MAG: F390 synthetase-related protein [Dehalogenimonas sp.]